MDSVSGPSLIERPSAPMRVLVTGHNGYIGSVLVPALQAAGHDVLGLDTFFFEDCSVGLADREEVPALRMDVRDVEPSDLRGVDAVVHLAGLSDDPRETVKPEIIHAINHHGAVHLARSARAAGVGRFLLASSCRVYESGRPERLTEDASLGPMTPYEFSKAGAEEDVARLADDEFSPILMRCATAYGISPRLRADLVLNNLVCWAYTTGRARIKSDGTWWRPLIHVQDLAQAFVEALDAPRALVHGQAFNVGTHGENYQISELAEIVRQAVPGSSVEYAPEDIENACNYRVDFTKLSRTFPRFKPHWNALFGAKDLYRALQDAGVTRDDLEGRKYIRLRQLRHLLASTRVDEQLRWVTAPTSGMGH
jgi:nucleoside-diphosphate-sugar epimerase